MRVVACETASEMAGLCSGPGLPALRPSDFDAQRGDLHLSAVTNRDEVAARCSLWWRNTPQWERHRVGIIGHYAAENSTAAATVLAAADSRLWSTGCSLAIGPMDGNTWRSYRFVTEPGKEPSFFLEPVNPLEWPMHFCAAGFSPLATYFSSLNKDLSATDPGVDEIAKRMRQAGVTIRLANSNLRSELPAIYAVSRLSFKQNFLYTEIAEAEFLALYDPVLPVARPEMILLAERDGHCVGYLFAVPDLAQAARGLEVDTFIVKTVAILPEPELRGLGSLLVARAQQQGHGLGFRRCIHALMFENNFSLKISRRYASVMRKYTLYSKELAR